MKLAKLYLKYEKIPWELGYPYYEEIDAIMYVVTKYFAQRRKRDEPNREAQKDFDNIRTEKPQTKQMGIGSY